MLFTDDAVRAVYSFKVGGSGPSAATGAMAATGAYGVFLRPVKAMVITTPASYRQKKGEETEDSCEDLGLTHKESDLDEEDAAVDTDAESCHESGNTSAATGAYDSSTGSEAAPEKSPPRLRSHR